MTRSLSGAPPKPLRSPSPTLPKGRERHTTTSNTVERDSLPLGGHGEGLQAAATLTELRFPSPGLRAKHATLGKHPTNLATLQELRLAVGVILNLMVFTNLFLPIILLRVTPTANRNTYSVATLIIHIPRVEALHASTLGYEIATPSELPGVRTIPLCTNYISPLATCHIPYTNYIFPLATCHTPYTTHIMPWPHAIYTT